MSTNGSTHVEAEQFRGQQRSAQTSDSRMFNLAVLVPEEIEIRMVDASLLSEYEVWFFAASLICNALVGFGVSAAVESEPRTQNILIAVSVVFLVLLIGALVMTVLRRIQLKRKSRKFAFGSSTEVTERPAPQAVPERPRDS